MSSDARERHACASVVVSGRVQGVWFRGSTRDMAKALGLTGHVRNLPGGSVEAVFEGPITNVQKAVAWCHSGPRMAEVESVNVEWGEATGQYKDFAVRY